MTTKKISDALYMHINKETQEVMLTHDKEREEYGGAVIYFDEINKLITQLKKVK